MATIIRIDRHTIEWIREEQRRTGATVGEIIRELIRNLREREEKRRHAA